MDYFNYVFTAFLGLKSGSCVAVNGGTEISKMSLKRSSFVFWRWMSFLGEL